jgi:hypothetical protein
MCEARGATINFFLTLFRPTSAAHAHAVPDHPPRLTTLVTVGVSATVLLTVLSLLILVDHFAIDYARREAEQRLQQLSWQMRDALNGVVRKATGDVQLLSELPRLREGAIRPRCGRCWKACKNLPRLCLDRPCHPGRQGIRRHPGRAGRRGRQHRDWFKGGRDKINAADYPPAAQPGKKLPYDAAPWRFVDASGPVLGADGKLRGVLCVRMSWGWARRMVQTVFAPAGQQYAADIFVVRNDGIAILGPQGMEDQRIRSASMALAARRQRRAQGNLGRWPRLPDRLRAHRHARRSGHADLDHPGAPAGSRWPCPARARWNTRSCCWAPSSAP